MSSPASTAGAPRHFDAVVLCGGASRRMGRDKAFVEIDGMPMLLRVADALRDAGADSVTAVGGPADAVDAVGLGHVPDRWPGEGPLGGIVTALDRSGADVVVALACDLLHPSAAAIRAVVDRRAVEEVDVAVPVVGGRPQWLHGAWHRRVTSLLRDVFVAGERSIVGAAPALSVGHVSVPDEATADADTPDELASGGRVGSHLRSPR